MFLSCICFGLSSSRNSLVPFVIFVILTYSFVLSPTEWNTNFFECFCLSFFQKTKYYLLCFFPLFFYFCYFTHWVPVEWNAIMSSKVKRTCLFLINLLHLLIGNLTSKAQEKLHTTSAWFPCLPLDFKLSASHGR